MVKRVGPHDEGCRLGRPQKGLAFESGLAYVPVIDVNGPAGSESARGLSVFPFTSRLLTVALPHGCCAGHLPNGKLLISKSRNRGRVRRAHR